VVHAPGFVGSQRYCPLVAIRNRLCPAPGQEQILSQHCAHARYVWNLAVEQESWWRPGRDTAPGFASQAHQLAEARAAEPWLAAGSSSIQQQALRDFSKAMAAFFDMQNPARRPGYRSAKRGQGFAIRDTVVRRLSRRWGEVQVPKCGWVRFRWTRPLPGKLGVARVSLDRAGRWHISFPGGQPPVASAGVGGRIGIDRGVRIALVTSDGQHYRAPRISDRQAARYLALQRKLARQRTGSARRRRTGRQMSVLTARVADRRKDWIEKISTRLVTANDVIVLEKLNIQGMVRRPGPKPDPDRPGSFLPNGRRSKGGLNRAILASGWGMLGHRLKQKGDASGVTAVFVDPRFTSQQCHPCGHTEAANRESQVFRCQRCGHEDHADANAARNILARGLATLSGEVPARAPGHGARRLHQPLVTSAAGTTPSAA
jgi:putative transposase